MSARNEVTIYDIAEALSVSPSTVSRALTSGISVHKETREKVLAKARDLGYRQNIFASNLRTQRTNLLGIVVPHINDLETSNIVSQIELVAKQAGYDVIVSQSLNDPDIHLNNVNSLSHKRVDGLLVLPADFFTPVSQPVEMAELKIPSVFLEAWLPFTCNERPEALQSAAYDITMHLIAKGCRRVAYVAVKPNQAASNEVFQGYCNALQAKQMTSDILMGSGAHFEQAIRKCSDLLSTEAAPDGFIFLDETITAFSVPSSKDNHSYIHGKKFDLTNYRDEMDRHRSAKFQNEMEAGKVVANMLFTLMR
jgi:LacI family transcriptional regulator